MRFFITGANGYIGSAIVREVLDWHHEAHGLVRSADKAAHIEGLGAHAVIGVMEDPSAYSDAASECDVLVHAATDYNVEHDRSAVETLIGVARKSPRPKTVIYTSGVY